MSNFFLLGGERINFLLDGSDMFCYLRSCFCCVFFLWGMGCCSFSYMG